MIDFWEHSIKCAFEKSDLMSACISNISDCDTHETRLIVLLRGKIPLTVYNKNINIFLM